MYCLTVRWSALLLLGSGLCFAGDSPSQGGAAAASVASLGAPRPLHRAPQTPEEEQQQLAEALRQSMQGVHRGDQARGVSRGPHGHVGAVTNYAERSMLDEAQRRSARRAERRAAGLTVQGDHGHHGAGSTEDEARLLEEAIRRSREN